MTLWDAGTGREIRSFAGHTGWVYALAFAPDGGSVLSGSMDATLRHWDFTRPGRYRDFGESVLRARKALAERPDDPQPSRNAGKVLTLLNRHEEAEREFKEALEKDHTRLKWSTDADVTAQILMSLGETFIAMGDLEAASEQFSRARELTSDRRILSRLSGLVRQTVER